MTPAQRDECFWRYELESIYGAAWDRDMQPIYAADWSDYEESAHIYILERAGQFYVQHYAYSVMADQHQIVWDPEPISFERAIELIDQWENS